MINEEENETIIADNKYLVTDARFKSRYDATDILINGVIPELKDAGERFVCAFELGKFVSANGINRAEANIAKFLATMPDDLVVTFCDMLNAEQLSLLVKHPASRAQVKRATDIILNLK